MKKKVGMSLLDIVLLKLAVFLGSCWLIGLLASYWPFQILLFLIQNKWYLLLAAVLVSLLPCKRFFSQQMKTKRKAKKK
ncbi:hypothetical protein CMI41_02295 [Candidatus Pacearchaeota archaeon]|nr:hypothetical protein [Candidatus Pacearchaeota archaeon]|tara:strand:+ start:1824 stop:2060 length:237 start_codon:yes stop_codon:yes gene_type:complete